MSVRWADKKWTSVSWTIVSNAASTNGRSLNGDIDSANNIYHTLRNEFLQLYFGVEPANSTVSKFKDTWSLIMFSGYMVCVRSTAAHTCKINERVAPTTQTDLCKLWLPNANYLPMSRVFETLFANRPAYVRERISRARDCQLGDR